MPPVAVNEPALQILVTLGDEAKHGYAVMQDLAAESGGRIGILPGTLYSTLKRLLADGLIEECAAPKDAASDDGRRRYYRVTRSGRRLAAAETQRLAVLVRLGRVFVQ